MKKRDQRGFTLIELLVGLGILGSVLPLVGTGIFQMTASTGRMTEGLSASASTGNPAIWLMRDIPMADSSDLVDGGAPASSARFAWTDYFGGLKTGHVLSYSLEGRELLRTLDGVNNVIGRNTGDLRFSKSGKLINITIASAPTGRFHVTDRKSFTVLMRPDPGAKGSPTDEGTPILALTSSATLPSGAVVVQATLTDGGSGPLPGQVVTFRGGNYIATGMTDENGVASAVLPLQNGRHTLDASFAGDQRHQPSNTPSQSLVVYQTTSFVIWGGNLPTMASAVPVGRDFVFWSDQWEAQVTAGDYTANPSFKGFANQVTGGSWTTDPGNSSGPPASVGAYISVIVATHINKSGSVLSGNVAGTAVLAVDDPAAYKDAPGHGASGVVVAPVQ